MATPAVVDGSVLEDIPWEPGSESLRVADSGAVVVSEGGCLRHVRLAHQQRARVARLVCSHASGAQVESVRDLMVGTTFGCVPISFLHPDDAPLGTAGVWFVRGWWAGMVVDRGIGSSVGVQGAIEVLLEEVSRPVAVLAASGGAVPPDDGGDPGGGGDEPPDGTPGGTIGVNVDGVGQHDMAPAEP